MVVHLVPVSRLSAWARALSARYVDARCLSAGSRRFGDHPVPAEFVRHPHGRLTGRPDTAPTPRPDRSGMTTVRRDEMRVGWVPSLRRSHGVPAAGHTAAGLSCVRHRGRRAWLDLAVLMTHHSGYCASDDASARGHAFPGPAREDGSPSPWALSLSSHPYGGYVPHPPYRDACYARTGSTRELLSDVGNAVPHCICQSTLCDA